MFYTLNGKPVVRKKREKLSKAEKENMNASIKRQNSRLGAVSKFCKMLRYGVPEEYAGHSNRHGTLVQHVAKEILQRDSISSRDDFKIRKEHLHHLNGAILNDEFPLEILKKLTLTKFEFEGENLNVVIPKLILSKLAKKPEAFKLWVQLKIISLEASYDISYVRLKESDSIDSNENQEMVFSFDVPETSENEGVFAAIGFRSLKGGKMIEDLRMNGYVVVNAI
ncbi:hypothetical protein G3O08_18100 [Cryomorpha ignava]|uniref:Uncharacterized protein n=1 Tax=Cryomorpha ignava TaxID=101383 RepID=A0A7K3WUR4_9FLAO|nr:hypothetical protein [Cryomorpha ignava]NEN25413.1 hypothetical protein [Cryomorpha ignava]